VRGGCPSPRKTSCVGGSSSQERALEEVGFDEESGASLISFGVRADHHLLVGFTVVTVLLVMVLGMVLWISNAEVQGMRCDLDCPRLRALLVPSF
jgi:hypothetical protein